MTAAVALTGLDVGDSPQSWAHAGFEVDGAVCAVGSVGIRLRGDGNDMIGWSLSGPASAPADIGGVPTSRSPAAARSVAIHPNGVAAIDHVVLMSPNLDRTVRALTAIGVDPRRERDAEMGGRAIRQIFFRFGEVIVEVVGAPGAAGDGPSSLWGITFTVADIDVTAAFFGDRTAPVKDAVQPGRRITTLRHRDLGMSVRTAFISASR
ncbi:MULTISPECIES: VOC family protein [Mycolicibacterium]|uniref:Glyoxalase/bleomycin resistance protein/dioxygenase n=1 Tax=Mycolicibacterium gilvum (strain DSM 45189 / LMG 24558 / Spyr1) TaxID=278137 RepID=E6THX0_MYCSR|nr:MULTISPECIES: glyoxalase [Mycolicibacterium]ADT97917.1 hypothetical protein Mspyr1_12370 [Mycolicibacterium gilvum Spyr1]MBV5246824.1 VOC family protein [Mycolicibacterium sp. PAM1]